MSRVTYTAETIERAFDHHLASGKIVSWSNGAGKGRYVVTGRSRHVDPLELRSLRECWIFLNGLMNGAMSDTDS